jgi:hypothetical protein
MSRAYRIAVAERVCRHVVLADGVRTQLELLDILPPEGTREILAREVAGRGFKIDGTKATRVDDGVTVEVDLETGAVTVRAEQGLDVDVTVERARNVAEETAQGKKDEVAATLAIEARAQAENEAKAREQRAQREVTARLERKLNDLQRELDEIGNRTTAEALKVKAAQLGEIEEITEDRETGSLTIRVRT